MDNQIHQQIHELFPKTREIQPDQINSLSGGLKSDIVQLILNLEALSLNELQIKLLPIAAQYHVSPISDYAVGAVILGQSGNIYFGPNMEFENTALHFTIHAEQCAVVNTAQHLEKGIVSIAVNAPPCGFCRQFVNVDVARR